jgi:hypothetical protein
MLDFLLWMNAIKLQAASITAEQFVMKITVLKM